MKTDEDKVLQLDVVWAITNLETNSIWVLFFIDRLVCIILDEALNTLRDVLC
jgi:hypothetical protein